MSLPPVPRAQTPVDFNPTKPTCANSSIVAEFNASAPEWTPPPRATMSAVVSIISLTMCVASLVAFAVLKQRFQRTKVRPLVVPRLAFIGVLFFIVSANVPSIWGFEPLPCWFPAFVTLSIPSSLGVALLLKAMYFLLMTRFAVSLAVFGRRAVDASGGDTDTDADTDPGGPHSTAVHHQQPPRRARRILTNIKATLDVLVFATKTIINPLPTREELMRSRDATARADQARTLEALKFVMSTRGQSLFEGFVASPFLLFNIIATIVADPSYNAGCFGCFRVTPAVLYINFVQGSILLAFGVFLAYRLRGLKDPFGVFWEGRLCLASIIIAVVFYSIGFFTNARASSSPFDWWSISLLFVSLVVVFTSALPVWMGWREEAQSGSRFAAAAKRLRRARRKQQAADKGELLSTTNRQSSLKPPGGGSHGSFTANDPSRDVMWILNDARLKAAFEKYLETEFCPELLIFLEITDEWKRSFVDIAPTARLSRARRIANSFIGAGAVQEVNVSDRVSRAIRTHLADAAANPAKLTQELFDEARQDVVVMLEHGPLMRFLETPEAEELLAAATARQIVPSGHFGATGAHGATPPSSGNEPSVVSSGRPSNLAAAASALGLFGPTSGPGSSASATEPDAESHAWNVLGTSLAPASSDSAPFSTNAVTPSASPRPTA